MLNLCVRLSVRPSDILLARTQGNGYHSVSGVSLSVRFVCEENRVLSVMGKLLGGLWKLLVKEKSLRVSISV